MAADQIPVLFMQRQVHVRCSMHNRMVKLQTLQESFFVFALHWKGTREAEHFMHSPAYTTAPLFQYQQAKGNRARL